MFIIVKIWKQLKNAATNEYINKLWYIDTMESKSEIKTNELFITATTWINLKCNRWVGEGRSKKSTQGKKEYTLWWLHLYNILENLKSYIVIENRSVVVWVRGVRKRDALPRGTKKLLEWCKCLFSWEWRWFHTYNLSNSPNCTLYIHEVYCISMVLNKIFKKGGKMWCWSFRWTIVQTVQGLRKGF